MKQIVEGRCPNLAVCPNIPVFTLTPYVLFLGPLTSVLVSIFGCRKVVSFGAVVTCAAFFFCTWSPNVQVMIILYGLVAGEY